MCAVCVCVFDLTMMMMMRALHAFFSSQILLNHTDLHNWDPIIYIWFVFHWLAMSHSCYNPVIYCYMNARFRVGFLQVLYVIPGIRRCGCIRPFARGRSSSLRTAMALTGKCICGYLFSIGWYRYCLCSGAE